MYKRQELSKAGLSSDDETLRRAAQSTLVTVLSGIVRMLHPFMPFVTEEIYLAIPHTQESINLEAWPCAVDAAMSEEEMTAIRQLITMIEAVRSLKAVSYTHLMSFHGKAQKHEK